MKCKLSLVRTQPLCTRDALHIQSYERGCRWGIPILLLTYLTGIGTLMKVLAPHSFWYCTYNASPAQSDRVFIGDRLHFI